MGGFELGRPCGGTWSPVASLAVKVAGADLRALEMALGACSAGQSGQGLTA